MQQDNQTDIETIKAELKTLAKENNLELTDNLEKIIKAKIRFFGKDNWHKCPCIRDALHACISDACRKQIDSVGICHCNLFKKVKEENGKI